MALTDIDINAITEADLKAAVAEGLRLSMTLAFTPEAYNHPFVRDISSLANTNGGLMLVGIADKDGVATGFAPLTGNPDAEMRDLATRLQTGIVPPVPGVPLRAIGLAGGGLVVALRVPRSRQAPHSVADPRDARSTLVYTRVVRGAIKMHPRAVDEWPW
jgi:predicted HTH transcriptional regulator